MSVTGIIDRVFPYASGFGRTGTRSILQLIERAQDRLYAYDGQFMRFIDPTDNKGFPPYLQTTAGTYKYDITAANLSCSSLVKRIGGTDYAIRCREVKKVFRDVSKSDYGNVQWIGKPYIFYNENPYNVNTDRLQVADIPVEAHPALENTSAYVIFPFDPGTTTDVYFCDFLIEPPRLDSESIPLSVPLDYEEAIEDFVMGRIQRLSNGTPNDFEARFQEYWIPKFRSEVATSGASYRPLSTQVRPC